MRRVVFDGSFGPYIGEFPQDADSTWLQAKPFDVAFMHWRTELEKRRDVFLVYCSAATAVADRVRRFLEDDV